MGMNTKEKARMALRHRLFVPGWSLNPLLRKIAKGESSWKIYLHWEDGKPVGICAKNPDKSEGWFFVRKEYRRRGIASKLAKRAKIKRGNAGGAEGCTDFFDSMGIDW